MLSPLSWAALSFAYSALNVTVDCKTLPTCVLRPTSTQPSVCSLVFPICTSTPEKPLTPSISGKKPLQNLYFVCQDLLYRYLGLWRSSLSLYVPRGIAVCPITFMLLILSRLSVSFSPLSLSSNVSQKYTPSI